MNPTTETQIPDVQPTVGRIVHFAYGETQCAAIVTSVDNAIGTVGLHVFMPNDLHEKAGQKFTTRADYNTDGMPGTWRYPPRV